jgi:hypothetical protein
MKALVGSQHLAEIDGKRQIWTVRPASGKKHTFICLTHKQEFETREKLQAHLSDRADHVYAKLCRFAYKESVALPEGTIEVDSILGLEADE